MTGTLTFGDRLAASPVYQSFRDHPFFAAAHTAELTTEQVAVLVEQWWHPLHYFPTFLARCVATIPDIGGKSAIARILDEEAGLGRVDMAHEVIYVDSMERCGFDRERVSGTAPYAETAALVEGYRVASQTHEDAIGFIFATENTDLLMVSSIGEAVRRSTGVADNHWVSIHVEQEPGHVEEANHALMAEFTPEQSDAVVAAADDMWRLWIAFFDRLAAETGTAAATPRSD